MTLAPPEEHDGRMEPGRRHALARGDDDASAPLVDDAAVEEVQRRRHHARREHLLDRDVALRAHHRPRMQRRRVPLRDRDRGELLRRGAVLVHVAAGHHREVRDPGRAEHRLERAPELGHVLDRGVAVGRGVARARTRGRGRHHHHLGQAVGDGQRRQTDSRGLAGGADAGGGVEAQRVAHDVGHRRGRERVAHAEPLGCGADEAVDVGEGQAGVGQRALHALPVEVGL